MRSIFVSLLILAMMSVACLSESSTRECSLGPDGQMKCTENKDPNESQSEDGSHGGSWGVDEFVVNKNPGNIQNNEGNSEVEELDKKMNKSHTAEPKRNSKGK
ncbi:hypothetical protein TNCT_157771 [Trichonephila clavata]|uniref:Uncharacterized protein n=1 Tax=Trichonephila clavata TaxID=2740835 RepID=A0A8X6HB89_TRICU|nr:hypothetical protein TNCT_157771 [Trichonephila clavata]